mgnify:CR=1 FL=1
MEKKKEEQKAAFRCFKSVSDYVIGTIKGVQEKKGFFGNKKNYFIVHMAIDASTKSEYECRHLISENNVFLLVNDKE